MDAGKAAVRFTTDEPPAASTIGAPLFEPALATIVKVPPYTTSTTRVCVMMIWPLVAVMSALKLPSAFTVEVAVKFKLMLVPKPDNWIVVDAGVTVTPAGRLAVLTLSVTVPEKPPTGKRETDMGLTDVLPVGTRIGEKKLMVNVGFVATETNTLALGKLLA